MSRWRRQLHRRARLRKRRLHDQWDAFLRSHFTPERVLDQIVYAESPLLALMKGGLT